MKTPVEIAGDREQSRPPKRGWRRLLPSRGASRADDVTPSSDDAGLAADDEVTVEPAAPRRRLTRLTTALRLLGFLVVVVILVGLGMIASLRIGEARALSRLSVAGIGVEGLDADDLTRVLEGVAEQRANAGVTVSRAPVPGREPEPPSIPVSAADLGYEFDVDATVSAVLSRGRQGNPLVAVRDLIGSAWARSTVEPVEHLPEQRLREWAAGASATLELAPQEGDLRIEGTEVHRIEPAPGASISASRLATAVRRAMRYPWADAVEPAAVTTRPRSTSLDLDSVEAAARQALSAPVTLFRGETSLTFSPEQIGAVLTVEARTAVPPLRLQGDPSRLAEVVGAPFMAAFDSDPVDAGFVMSNGVVEVVPAVEGFRFDPDVASAQLVEVASGFGDRVAPLEGEIIRPALTTEEARSLRIVEEVASFTTEFQAGQSRVQNIHRIAQLVDGAVIRPGETFSLNDHVGPRTVEGGFTTGGAIANGEFVTQVGGGVSQFATTLFNAAYFAGLELVEFKPHSYYISRYPVGREATVNYPNVDLKIRNNSPSGMLLRTAYTGTSITVSVWGTRWVEVEAIEGPRRYHGGGFTITVTRVLRFPDGREETEQHTTRYRASAG